MKQHAPRSGTRLSRTVPMAPRSRPAARHVVPLLLAAFLLTGAAVSKQPTSPRGLLESADTGNAESVRKALSAGSPVDASDADGWTALHFASANGHLTVIEELISAGAKVNVVNADGMTPLMLAVVGSHVDAVTTLRAAKASTSARNAKGASALQLALKSNNAAVVAAVTEGMGDYEYLTNLDDLAPILLPDGNVEKYMDAVEKKKPVNPKGLDRNGVARLLRDTGEMTPEEIDASLDEGLDLASLEKVLRRYAATKHIDFDRVTVGTVLTAVQGDYNELEKRLWDRIRSSHGVLDGSHGFYQLEMPFGRCAVNNVNVFLWSEGSTIYFADSVNPDFFGPHKVLKRGGAKSFTTSENPPVTFDQAPSQPAYKALDKQCLLSRGFEQKGDSLSLPTIPGEKNQFDRVMRIKDACGAVSIEGFYKGAGLPEYGAATRQCMERYNNYYAIDESTREKYFRCLQDAKAKHLSREVELQEFTIEEPDGERGKIFVGDGYMQIVTMTYKRCIE